MSSSTLELLRAGHEDIESFERAIVSILNEKPRNHKARVLHGHKVSQLLDNVTARSRDVLELYEDKEGAFKDEVDALHGRANFTSFYDHLKNIREFHRKYPNVEVIHEPSSLEAAMDPTVEFSGEERFGKYVDLHAYHTQFLNLPVFASVNKMKTADTTKMQRGRTPEYIDAPVDYITYLSRFGNLAKIPEAAKFVDSRYETYLTELRAYLTDFYRRTQPLVDLDDVVNEAQAQFEKSWALGQVKGWAPAADTTASTYCKACQKQFASEAVFTGHLKGKKHLKAAAQLAAGGPAPDVRKALANLEVHVKTLIGLLTEVVHATISFLELKQTRTPEELQAEILEEEDDALSDVEIDNDNVDDDDEQPFYNPLNLPLGWDGKPIPYWLYKLHGLGVEFKCEICGNHSYWGRRDFDRHFQQWRHAHGMRCLGIPNTKHFHDITSMADALALYEKLKEQLEKETWNKANEEEFEDSEGNVLNKKTYQDLARQGLL
ncbi:splicing factor 3A [Achlya hypogyna]|uniref:Splicing factor 3A n=1 Tax=Achlya hypogyna TaxID=1202772 RepID=A0A1V9Z208_ACHHY|nr:splicing factor 3A [Achlya hypogyna]